MEKIDRSMITTFVMSEIYALLEIDFPKPHQTFDFPGAIPVSISRSDLQALNPNDYYLSEKSDGTRYMLYLTEYQESPQGFLIDRKCEVANIQITGPAVMFQKTLFDGEMVKMNDRHVFLIFDVLIYAGKRVVNHPFKDRYKFYTKELINYSGSVLQGNNFEVRPKAFLAPENLQLILDSMRTRPYSTDGLIFMPIHEPVVFKTHWTQFKFKMYHTIDLLMDLGVNGLRLSYRTRFNGEPVYANILTEGIFTNREAYQNPYQAGAKAFFGIEDRYQLLYHLQGKLMENRMEMITSIVECQIADNVSGGQNLIPLKLRTDKAEPNNDWTVQQTYLQYMERITWADIMNLMPRPLFLGEKRVKYDPDALQKIEYEI